MWLTAFLVLAATVYRLLPHPENFAPIGALFLLSGLYLPRRGGLAWVVPFAAVLISDAVIYYQWDGRIFHTGRLVDYAAFALIGLMGFAAKNRGLATRIATVIATPVVFFIISNFGVWLGTGYAAPLYPHTFDGLVACYVAAVPFFRATLASDLVFAGGGMLLIEALRRSHAPALQRLSQPAAG